MLKTTRRIRSPRLTARTGLAALAAGLGLVLAVPAIASEATINDMMGGGGASASSLTTNAAPETTAPAAPAAPTDATAAARTGALGGIRSDAWLKSANAIDHLNVIAARPLPGETCQNVIFDARPYLKTRFEPGAGTRIDLQMSATCLLGFRNDSVDRRLVIRLGESFETMAIAADPQLFTGLVVAPGQQIMIAMRPLPVEKLDIGLEVSGRMISTASRPRSTRPPSPSCGNPCRPQLIRAPTKKPRSPGCAATGACGQPKFWLNTTSHDRARGCAALSRTPAQRTACGEPRGGRPASASQASRPPSSH